MYVNYCNEASTFRSSIRHVVTRTPTLTEAKTERGYGTSYVRPLSPTPVAGRGLFPTLLSSGLVWDRGRVGELASSL